MFTLCIITLPSLTHVGLNTIVHECFRQKEVCESFCVTWKVVGKSWGGALYIGNFRPKLPPRGLWGPSTSKTYIQRKLCFSNLR